VTGRHRGPKRKLRAGYRVPSLKWTFYFALASVTDVLVFVVKCGMCFLCAMHVFDVQASSLPPRLPFCQIPLLWRPPCRASQWWKTVYSVNHSLTQSLNHPASLMLQEPKLLLRKSTMSTIITTFLQSGQM